MTTQDVQLVQRTFDQVRPIADIAAELFYTRLFELDPSVRPLFKGDLKEQGRKLMNMLQLVVRGLDHPEKIIPAVQQLGVRHAGYGIQEAHYDTVWAALLWTLEQGLREAFTPEVHAAWASAYTLLAGLMRDAARSHSAAPSAEPA